MSAYGSGSGGYDWREDLAQTLGPDWLDAACCDAACRDGTGSLTAFSFPMRWWALSARRRSVPAAACGVPASRGPRVGVSQPVCGEAGSSSGPMWAPSIASEAGQPRLLVVLQCPPRFAPTP